MRRAMAQKNGATQNRVFGGAPGGALSPHAERGRLHMPAHQRDDTGLIESELRLNGLERGAVFPGHFHNTGDVSLAHGCQSAAPALPVRCRH